MQNPQYDYDVMFIGAGHASDGASLLVKNGYKVAKIEAERVGGTCANWACNAKVVLDGAVELARTQERLAKIAQGNLKLSWDANMEHKHQVIRPLDKNMEKRFVNAGIDVIRGWATLVDAHTVDIDGKKYTSDKFVIATGLHPNKLNVPGVELTHDSKDFLDLEPLPKHMTIVGSGYISMEFATIANAFGSNVTVMMHGDRALRKFHQPYVEKVMADLTDRGVRFIKNANVSGFTKDGDQLFVEYGDGQKLATDWILDATGRNPNLTGYGLDELGIDYSDRGVTVNGKLQTNVANIFAAGDVANTDQPKLTPTATHHSNYIAHVIMGDTNADMKPYVVPTVTFTSPRIAEAGVSIEEAKANPDKYQLVESDVTGAWFRQITQDQIADQALIFDHDDHLVGATEVSEEAEDFINGVLPAIALKLNREQREQLAPLFPSIMHEGWKNLI
ncbi:NAD(P)/FAD-dependent oxidoreductase [Lactobacillus sp. Sy-1]|uniref:dihydrolipoyl dehydrogenase family protein n=1 Tax=Lactobacillus sp. Sy-1 TaxID=2109645 RepID=UPI001C56E321|nr:NAD(P)/FAD-dependent oxidoreductase [Lactobacillus sp. Sy-1]MBW1605023.1 NAD(P)/FAD-dependent oxidoreductase [Lactobacillus sp. Sy-1]